MDKTLGQLWAHPGDISIMQAVLVLVILAAIILLTFVQMKKDAIDLRWLILDEKKRPSLHKISQVTALCISTWGFVTLTLHNQLTEYYFTGYMVVWSGSVALDKYLSNRHQEHTADTAAEGPH